MPYNKENPQIIIKEFAILLSGTPDAVAVIQKEFNLSALALNGDHTDEMVFSDANIMNRIKS